MQDIDRWFIDNLIRRKLINKFGRFWFFFDFRSSASSAVIQKPVL